jgi:glycosyltransferase involved in cell wall biosynthesis
VSAAPFDRTATGVLPDPADLRALTATPVFGAQPSRAHPPAAPPVPPATSPAWPSIGVVIPTRNRPEHLATAISGAVGQDYPGPVSIVVVYDQSEPDLTLARTEGARPIEVITNRRAAGLAGARNTGVLALATDLVAFCDDDDTWTPTKLRRQVETLRANPQAQFVTCAIEVSFKSRLTPRLAGTATVELSDLVRSRMAMLHASGFLIRRRCLVDGSLGLVAEDAPGSQNEDWDMLLRAAKQTPIVHVDEPLVRVLWGRSSHFAYEYATKIESLRWMLKRHPEIADCPIGAARVYGQLACWSAATGDRRSAWTWARAALGANWKEPRAAIALAAVSRLVKVEYVLSALHRRGRGI